MTISQCIPCQILQFVFYVHDCVGLKLDRKECFVDICAFYPHENNGGCHGVIGYEVCFMYVVHQAVDSKLHLVGRVHQIKSRQ